MDRLLTAASAKANVVLPLAGWSEQTGSFVNLEGRYQKFEEVMPLKKGIKTGIEILRALAEAMESPFDLDDKALESETKEVVDSWRREPRDCSIFYKVKQSGAVDHADYPYRLLIGNDLHHFGYLTEHCPSLMRFTSEVYLELSPNLAQKLGINDGDLIRVESTTGRLVLKARLSEFFEGEVLFIPNNFSSVDVNGLVSREGGGWVKIKKLDDK
jgi:NADH-quinone oxidoreductase subunit G